MSITVIVKPQGVSGATELRVTAEPAWTVATLKELVAGKLGLAAVRLVASGNILKEDGATLDACGLKDGGKIYALPDRSAGDKPPEDFKAKYAQQLEELKDMGFEDQEKNLAMLVKHGGDLDKSVDALAGVEEEAPTSPPVAAAAATTQEAAATGGCEVVANVYDISGGMAQMCAQQMIGRYMELLPHTGIVVFGQEFFCSQQPAVSEPGKSLPSPVRKTYALGRTSKTKEELLAFLKTLESEYTVATYDFIRKNSNHYADAVSKFLLDGGGIPKELLSLAEDMGATPQGQQMAQMLSQMQASNRNLFTPTGAFFHGGTEAPPQMAQMFAGLAGGQPPGAGGAMGGGAAQLPGDPKILYKAQLDQLASMGFTCQEAAVQALVQASGNLSLAVDILTGA